MKEKIQEELSYKKSKNLVKEDSKNFQGLWPLETKEKGLDRRNKVRSRY